MAVIRTYGLLFSNDRFGFILPPLFLAVIAEASRSMRYGTGSIAETAIRDLILITAHFCPAQFNDLRARGKQHCGNFLTTDPSHVVIAEARAHTRYGTGSVVAVDYPRSPHIAVISTPAGSHICSSDSCDVKALAHVFVVRQAHQPCKNCDSAQFSRQQ